MHTNAYTCTHLHHWAWANRQRGRGGRAARCAWTAGSPAAMSRGGVGGGGSVRLRVGRWGGHQERWMQDVGEHARWACPARLRRARGPGLVLSHLEKRPQNTGAGQAEGRGATKQGSRHSGQGGGRVKGPRRTCGQQAAPRTCSGMSWKPSSQPIWRVTRAATYSRVASASRPSPISDASTCGSGMRRAGGRLARQRSSTSVRHQARRCCCVCCCGRGPPLGPAACCLPQGCAGWPKGRGRAWHRAVGLVFSLAPWEQCSRGSMQGPTQPWEPSQEPPSPQTPP